ncbi:hypothetical protein SAMN04487818_102317 [Actinokineospora terrae]|uniref:Uncharacterized protein n=1 Tax=Actinokineospora terrae TaxID=155974 RepID=A0A1H9MT40_9PSEU|nr:hypothetical protein SAMN04487818_102317 [Actinokineospora terrae]
MSLVDGGPIAEGCLAALPSGWIALVDGELVSTGGLRWKVGTAEGTRLHTSVDGRYAAAVVDRGSRGVVVDLASGAVTAELDRGDYGSTSTDFPVAFLGTGEFVAATDWNQLGLFDAATGARRATHGDDIDFFHGGLTVSPSGKWLVIDGWIWQPVGAQLLVDLDAWRAGKHDATDVGPYPDDWNRPTAWLDDETIAVQGENGITLVAIPSGETKRTIAAPPGRLWSHDGRLYVAAQHGLEVWSPTERVSLVDGFRPIAQNPTTGALADRDLNTWLP